MPGIKKKKKWIWLIVLSVVLLIAIMLIALAIWQRNNIQAVLNYSKYSKTELEQKLSESHETLVEQIEKYAPDLMRDFTEEEKRQIASGEKTKEEVVEAMIEERAQKMAAADKNGAESGNKTSSSSNQANKNSQGAKPSSSGNAKETSEKIIGRYTAKIYSVRSKFVGQLNALEAQAKADYIRQKNQTGTAPSVSQMVSKYLGKASSLEKQCDSQMAGILSSLKSELKQNGMDTSIVSSIKAEYENEKSLKKAQYMERLR